MPLRVSTVNPIVRPMWKKYKSLAVRRGTCYLLDKSNNRKGYPQVSIKGRTKILTRLILEEKIGKPLGRLHALHTCDNPKCINPRHLFAGDNFVNQRDSVAKGRHWSTRKAHCKEGHPLSGSNLYVCPRGYRECKECRRGNVRRHRGQQTIMETSG